jgi:swarming motility protein ybiA
MKEIKFYKVNDAYGYMSNFAPYPFSDGNKIWPTSEHYFQAQKFLVPEIQEKIRLLESPMDAALEGRNRQNPEILEKLIATSDAELLEHTKNDHYWADGGDGSGKNMLGKILMETRVALSLDDGSIN